MVFLLDEQMGKEIFLQGLITHTGLEDQTDIASKSWINEENIKSNKNPAILWCALFSSSDWCKMFLLFILQGKPLKSQHFSIPIQGFFSSFRTDLSSWEVRQRTNLRYNHVGSGGNS